MITYACGLPALDVCGSADLMECRLEGDPQRFVITFATWTRAQDAVLEPVWAPGLGGPWSPDGVSLEWLAEDGQREWWKASVPPGDRGFARLRAYLSN